MKAIKRTVAALLATLMLATSTSFTLAAETYTAEEAEVVGKVNAAGIMTGTDKGFEPSKSLTRAEAAAIIVRMKGISESAVKTAAGTTLFNDVAASHWASGYVNQASNLGIVKGVSAKEFAPDREVTIAEFTTMAVRALGAGTLVDSEGTWPTNYVNFANEEGILDDVNAIYTATASRLQAATIVANTLETYMWKKVGVKSNGEIEWSNTAKETILTNTLNLVEKSFVLDKVSINDQEVKTIATTPAKTNNLVAANQAVADGFDLTTVKVGLTYSAYLNTKDDEITGMWLDTEDTVDFTAIAKAKAAGDDEITLKVDGKEKKYELASTAKLYENEDAGTSIYAAAVAKNTNAYGTAYLDEDGKISSIYATNYTIFAKVDEVTSKKVKMEQIYGSNTASITYDCEDCEYFLTKDGKGIKYSDLKAGDVICYYTVGLTSPHVKYVGEVVTSSVEGKVTAKGADYVKVDKVKYDMAISKMPSIDDEIIAYTNHAGKIVAWEKVEGAASDVAFVTYTRNDVNGKYDVKSTEVKLMFTDGTKSETLTVDYEATFDAYEENVDINVYTTGAALTAEETAVDKVNGAAGTLSVDTSYIVLDGAYFTNDATGKAAAISAISDNEAFYDEAGVLGTAGKYYFNGAVMTETTKETAGKAISDAKLVVANVKDGLVATCYELTGSDLTLKPYSEDENLEFALDASSTLKVNNSNSYITLFAGLKDEDGNAYTGRVYVSEKTAFFKVKADDSYGVKVSEVNFDDLDDNSALVNAIVMDWDATSKTAGVVICGIGSNVKGTSIGSYAMIEKVSTTKYDGETAKEVEVILANGTRETYYATKDDTTGYAALSASNIGELYDISVVGEVITELSVSDMKVNNQTAAYGSNSAAGTIVGHFGEYDEAQNSITVDGKDITLSDEVLVVEKDGSKYITRSISDLDEFDSESGVENTIVSTIYTLEESGEEPVVIFIVYSVVKNA